MSKRQWLMTFGVIVFILPYLGFPFSWLKVLFSALGILVVAVSYTLSKPIMAKNEKALPFKDFENKKETKEGETITNSNLPLGQ